MGPNNLKTSKGAKVLVGSLLVAIAFSTSAAFAQSKQYQRAKPAAEAAPAGAAATPGAASTGKDAKLTAGKSDAAPKAEGDKLDISELEQKYWAPKDTDFSVVQNRTYTKAKKFAFTAGYGPSVNNTFSSGNFLTLQGNYYFSERHGMELTYISADLRDSDATRKFKSGLSGGGVAPDFNREKSYMGIGYNFVPFYAKMSFMGTKIIYFDMQITPTLGMTKFEQQTESGVGDTKSVFAYGIDVTQYFFFSQHLAVRLNLHNRWSQQEERAFQSGNSLGKDAYNDTNFMFGLTWFFGGEKNEK